jgi:GTP diphosphokinase / guanosine-3',5'-bis(diphosphate) 3'-diphosphatase
MDTGRLLRALDLAAAKHRDQRRKDAPKSPYINHPIAVAQLLWECGVHDETAILAGVLHDTIEDTATTRDELAALFGAEVADVVAEVTDDKSLPKERRKELQVEHGPHLSHAAKLVKLADKTCNVRDIIDSPPDWPLERKQQYLVWAKRVVDGLRDASPELAARFDAQHARGV